MPDLTPRFAMPLLAAGQAQKELTHNEALTLADLLIAPVVVAVAPASVPASPAVGNGWIVGAAPQAPWDGQAHKLAFWTDGGWRFVAAPLGMTVWSIADQLPARRTESGWDIGQLAAATIRIGGNQVVGPRLAGIAPPAGRTTIDIEARAAIDALLLRLQSHGLIA